MSGSNSAERKRHEPLVLVETADISEEDWLDYRRRGIGGSDVSAIFGTSPFRTARDLYYDKLNIASVEDDEGNWVAMEMGHLLEPLVAKIFERKTGYRVYQIKKMFQHPQYPWMLADVDYFVELPDGTTAILEIKTTNYNARDNWWMNGKETVPVYYESQGRHYMAVTDLDRCFFCCLYGNNEEEVIIREVKRDFEYEAEMVFLEQYFWENHVQRHVPPPYTESGALIIESARKHFGPADKNAPAVALDLDTTIHKAMGSEYEIVIMPLLKAHTIMMYRNLLYTGITRAKKRVVLIGQKQVLFMAIHRNEIGKRNTLLGMRIQMYFKAYAKKAGIPIPAALEEQLKNAS